jgi:hypothetical protein
LVHYPAGVLCPIRACGGWGLRLTSRPGSGYPPGEHSRWPGWGAASAGQARITGHGEPSAGVCPGSCSGPRRRRRPARSEIKDLHTERPWCMPQPGCGGTLHGAGVFIIRRSCVRASPAPPTVSSAGQGKAVDRFVDRRRRRDVPCRHPLRLHRVTAEVASEWGMGNGGSPHAPLAPSGFSDQRQRACLLAVSYG